MFSYQFYDKIKRELSLWVDQHYGKNDTEKVSPMSKVILYTKKICPLCDEALELLKTFQYEYDFEIEERDIYTNDQWLEKFYVRIPVVSMNGKEIDGEKINYEDLDLFLRKHMSKM